MARLFNGAGDFITLSNNANLAPAALTASAWIYPTSLPSSVLQGAITVRNGVSSANYNYILGTFLTNEATFFYNNTTHIDGGSLSTNTWFHIAGTVNAGGSVLYVNGSSVATGAGATLTNSINLATLGSDRKNHDWPGGLADCAIWSLALTAAEILALSNGARPRDIRLGSLVGWWPLTGLQSPEPDLSGNANNGTITGSPANAFGPPFMAFTPRWPQFTQLAVGGLFLPTEPLTGMRVGGPFFGNPIG